MVNGIAKVPKRSFPQWDSNPARTVRSPVQANALIHSATAPPSGRCQTKHSVVKRRIESIAEMFSREMPSRLGTLNIADLTILLFIVIIIYMRSVFGAAACIMDVISISHNAYLPDTRALNPSRFVCHTRRAELWCCVTDMMLDNGFI